MVRPKKPKFPKMPKSKDETILGNYVKRCQEIRSDYEKKLSVFNKAQSKIDSLKAAAKKARSLR